MTKLVDMIAFARTIQYREPRNSIVDEWTSDELLYKSIHIALVNDIQIRSALNICESFPPLKFIYKSILTKYIKHFTRYSMEVQPVQQNVF
jgi:hypothetical protein